MRQRTIALFNVDSSVGSFKNRGNCLSIGCPSVVLVLDLMRLMPIPWDPMLSSSSFSHCCLRSAFVVPPFSYSVSATRSGW